MDLSLPHARYNLPHGALTLTAGDILTLPVQGLVCYSSTSLTLHSAVAVRIVEQGGPGIRAEAAKHLPARVGDALVLTAGRLPSHYVLVAVTNELSATPTLDTVRAAIRAAFERGSALGLRSLALPLLRVRRRLDDDDLLVVTLAALIDQLSLPSSLQEVLLVAEGDAVRAKMVIRRAELFLTSLRQVGALRAEVQALSDGEATAVLLDEPELQQLTDQLRWQRHQALSRLLQLLEGLVETDGLPGAAGLRTELRYAQAEYEQLATALGHTLERQVGATPIADPNQPNELSRSYRGT